MTEAPRRMQVTLVAYYGSKPQELSAIVRRLQQCLCDHLGVAFRPYEMEQVHGTVVGLEGCRHGRNLRNQNAGAFMDMRGLVEFLRGPRFRSIRVHVGGYQSGGQYPFRSRNTHPYLRSFSIQDDIAVAMGWPIHAGAFPESLDQLRRGLQEFGVRHKWHRTDVEVDNDFFFVLGKIDRTAAGPVAVESTTEHVRAELASYGGTDIEIDRDTLRVVGYSDPQLPRGTSCCYGLDEPDLVAKIEELYRDCNTSAHEGQGVL